MRRFVLAVLALFAAVAAAEATHPVFVRHRVVAISVHAPFIPTVAVSSFAYVAPVVVAQPVVAAPVVAPAPVVSPEPVQAALPVQPVLAAQPVYAAAPTVAVVPTFAAVAVPTFVATPFAVVTHAFAFHGHGRAFVVRGNVRAIRIR